MNKITFPLKKGMQGRKVGDLQDALQLLLDKAIILREDEDTRQERSTAIHLERAKEVYGRITNELMRIFQRDRSLKVIGLLERYM